MDFGGLALNKQQEGAFLAPWIPVLFQRGMLLSYKLTVVLTPVMPLLMLCIYINLIFSKHKTALLFYLGRQCHMDQNLRSEKAYCLQHGPTHQLCPCTRRWGVSRRRPFSFSSQCLAPSPLPQPTKLLTGCFRNVIEDNSHVLLKLIVIFLLKIKYQVTFF